MAARIAIIAMTTSSSIRVKPRKREGDTGVKTSRLLTVSEGVAMPNETKALSGAAVLRGITALLRGSVYVSILSLSMERSSLPANEVLLGVLMDKRPGKLPGLFTEYLVALLAQTQEKIALTLSRAKIRRLCFISGFSKSCLTSAHSRRIGCRILHPF